MSNDTHVTITKSLANEMAELVDGSLESMDTCCDTAADFQGWIDVLRELKANELADSWVCSLVNENIEVS